LAIRIARASKTPLIAAQLGASIEPASFNLLPSDDPFSSWWSAVLDEASARVVAASTIAAGNTSYSLTASPSTVVEGNQVTFTISRSGDKPAETVYFSTLSDGTATYGEGDYTTTSGSAPANIAVTFSSGTTSRSVTLNIINDGVSDSGEQFRAIVQRDDSDPISTYLVRSSFVTINDATQNTNYSLTASPSTVTEGNQVPSRSAGRARSRRRRSIFQPCRTAPRLMLKVTMRPPPAVRPRTSRSHFRPGPHPGLSRSISATTASAIRASNSEPSYSAAPRILCPPIWIGAHSSPSMMLRCRARHMR
jgi:hypothetical protein